MFCLQRGFHILGANSFKIECERDKNRRIIGIFYCIEQTSFERFRVPFSRSMLSLALIINDDSTFMHHFNFIYFNIFEMSSNFEFKWEMKLLKMQRHVSYGWIVVTIHNKIQWNLSVLPLTNWTRLPIHKCQTMLWHENIYNVSDKRCYVSWSEWIAFRSDCVVCKFTWSTNSMNRNWPKSTICYTY